MIVMVAGGYQSDFLGFARLQKARGGFIHDKIDISQCCHQFLHRVCSWPVNKVIRLILPYRYDEISKIRSTRKVIYRTRSHMLI